MKAVKIMIKIFAGILLAGCAALGLLYWRKLPAIHVAKGLVNLAEETGEYGNPILEEAGWERIADRITGGAVRVDLEGSFLTQEQKEAFSMQAAVSLDEADKKMRIEADSRLLGFGLGSLMLAGDEDQLYLQLPGVTDQVFRIGTKDFGARYQNSMWARWLRFSIDEDYALKFVPDWKSTRLEETTKVWKEKIQTGRKLLSRGVYLVALVLDVEKAEAEPDCYVLTIPAQLLNGGLESVQKEIRSGKYGENVKAFWEELMSDMGIRSANLQLAEDLKILVRLDENDRITGIETAEPLSFTEASLGITIEAKLEGTEKTLDQVEGSVRFMKEQLEKSFSLAGKVTSLEDGRKEQWALKTPDTDYALDCSWFFDSKDFEITVQKEGAKERETGKPYQISLKGSLKAAREDSLTLNVDSLVFPFFADKTIEMSGALTVEPLTEEILLPETGVDFFGMSELDILAILLDRL